MKEIEEIAERLDLVHIEKVAFHVALRLRNHGAVAAYMTPGDGTAYQIMIADKRHVLYEGRHTWIGGRFLFSSNHGPQYSCLLYTSPSPRDRTRSRMPSSA